MAEVIRKATNKFTKGLVMDFSPENTQAEVLTHALNATLLTFNGNELSLQNDMGNARVETAFLPEGYMPVGTCEYGGIIYIVSYNPIEDKSQIGCFPSPERNISSKELGYTTNPIQNTDFQDGKGGLVNTSKYVLMRDDKLNPGDKFIVSSPSDIYNEKLSDLFVKTNNKFEPIEHPILSLNVVSIEDSGKIVYLNSDILQYENESYKYHILGNVEPNQKDIDIDSYRNVLSSGYSVFKSKTSGKLAILAELLMIDSYSVTHSICPRETINSSGEKVTEDGVFDVIIHTEITPEVNESNYKTVPKIQYYYLKNSQGYLQLFNKDGISITKRLYENNSTSEFLRTSLSDIYEPLVPDIKLNSTLGAAGKFSFPQANSYHGQMMPYSGEFKNGIYTKFSENQYHRVLPSQIKNNLNYFLGSVGARVYLYNKDNKDTYEQLTGDVNVDTTYYTKTVKYGYAEANKENGPENTTYYRTTSNPTPAKSEQILDTSIAKYIKVKRDVYTKYDINSTNNSKLYKKSETSTGVTFEEVSKDDIVEGETYYVKIESITYEYYGNEVDENSLNGLTLYYYPKSSGYIYASEEDIKLYFSDENVGFVLYVLVEFLNYNEATALDLVDYDKGKVNLYYKLDYRLLESSEITTMSDQDVFAVVPYDTYVPYSKFIPDTTVNYILGKSSPSDEYPKDDPISIHTISEFIPDTNNTYEYGDVKLASIKIPPVVFVSPLSDLPFKYDYTIVPCMNYGRLDHLAVSNTVDFSKLHAFNQSNFTTWKYHIDGNQLRLTFGAEVFDTYETNKIDGLVLEFYDWRGFAGSVEISDKKAYTGTFTKIIELNTLNAISKNKISGNSYVSNTTRNINIVETTEDGESNFMLNTNRVMYKGSDTGWVYYDSKENLSASDNDCGTLYTNVLYGVKAYLRRNRDDGSKEFILKKELFLFTLPIYNDFYYSINDFSTLINPKLDMLLTYKITDTSSKLDYNDGTTINGYLADDKEKVEKYLRGEYSEASLNLIKYYKYKGTSSLFLEVGLKQDYSELNLGYSPEINKYFSCSLQLISEDSKDRPYTVKSDKQAASIEELLNYSSIMTVNINKLGFGNNYDVNYDINGDILYNANFLTSEGIAPLLLNYEFVIGYKVAIDNIKSTETHVTTICALFHKQSSGEYNYSDFSIYVLETQNDSGDTLNWYLYDAMFYNEGTANEEVFGICRQIDIEESTTITLQCFPIRTIKTEATPIAHEGKLNTGDSLKLLTSYIGKLTFCQPHVHGLSEVNGVNVYETTSGRLGIAPKPDTWVVKDTLFDQWADYDDTYGIVPTKVLYEKPLYNLSLNTKNSINLYSEFISTLDYDVDKGKIYGWDYTQNKQKEVAVSDAMDMRVYTGFTGAEVEQFNRKLLKTMSNVYAYNPDYDSIMLNVGEINVEDLGVKFTSNIISKDSVFEFPEGTTLNDFIYLGPVRFSDYLKDISTYSVDNLGRSITIYKQDPSNEPLDQVKLVPGTTYCGETDKNYLVSSLTYNTPAPPELEQELSFNSGNIVYVKHCDGTKELLKGFPDTKILYGYEPTFKKLIPLDVSNYNIDEDGTLSLTGRHELQETTIEKLELKRILQSTTYEETRSVQFNGANLNSNVDVTINVLINNKLYTTNLSVEGEYLYIGRQLLENNEPLEVVVSLSQSDDTYKVHMLDCKTMCRARCLSEEVAFPPVGYTSNYANFMTQGGLNNNGLTLSRWWKFLDVDQHKVTASGYTEPKTETDAITNGGNTKWSFVNSANAAKGTVVLYELKISDVRFRITRQLELSDFTGNIMEITPTTDYATVDNHKYSVNTEYQGACLRGTSITLNDLVYDPSQTGHRLFIKNGICQYDSLYRGRIFYRKLSDKRDPSWRYSETNLLNNIYMYTGPCFTIGNL